MDHQVIGPVLRVLETKLDAGESVTEGHPLIDA